MPDRDEVRRLAIEQLGEALARGAAGEYGQLAPMLGWSEAVEVMALGLRGGGRLTGFGRAMAATPRRILLVAKGMLPRREYVEEVPWDVVIGVEF